MELLRGKSPSIAEREVVMHLLAYNLLRTLMLRAAQQESQPLSAMSFAGTRHATRRCAPIVAHTSSKTRRQAAANERPRKTLHFLSPSNLKPRIAA